MRRHVRCNVQRANHLCWRRAKKIFFASRAIRKIENRTTIPIERQSPPARGSRQTASVASNESASSTAPTATPTPAEETCSLVVELIKRIQIEKKSRRHLARHAYVATNSERDRNATSMQQKSGETRNIDHRLVTTNDAFENLLFEGTLLQLPLSRRRQWGLISVDRLLLLLLLHARC